MMDSNCVVVSGEEARNVCNVARCFLKKEVTHLNILLDVSLLNEMMEMLKCRVRTSEEECVFAWLCRVECEFKDEVRRVRVQEWASTILSTTSEEDEEMMRAFGMEDDDEGDDILTSALRALDDEGLTSALRALDDEGGLLRNEGALDDEGALRNEGALDDEGGLLREEGGEEDVVSFVDMLKAPLVNLLWCGGGSGGRRVVGGKVGFLSGQIGRCVSYDFECERVVGRLTALFECGGNFIGSEHDQFFSARYLGELSCGVGCVVTFECDSVRPERFSRHECRVENGEQTCCSFEHFSVMFGVSSMLKMVGGWGRGRGRADRHSTIFESAKLILKCEPSQTMLRGCLMRQLSKLDEIKALFPGKRDVYHALRNVFQCSRFEGRGGETYYVRSGVKCMEHARDALWMYRVNSKEYEVKYVT